MVDAISSAWTVFSTIYTQLANMKRCKKLAAQLKQRLRVLEEAMRKLKNENVGGSAGVDRLVSNLSQLEAIITKISKRSGFVRFLTSSDDNEDLERFNRYVTDCVADLSLLTQLQIADDIRHLRWRYDEDDEPKAQAPVRNQEADRQLRCDEARRFYDEYYMGQQSMDRTEFWYCFGITLAEDDITSNYFLERLITHFCKIEIVGRVDVERLNAIFMIWSNRTEKQRILRLTTIDSQFEDFVDNFQIPYSRQLILRLTLVNSLFTVPRYQDGDAIMITPLGFEGLPPTRIVRFGRGEPSLNHVSFSVEDSSIDRNMFQISCNSDGYYIIDAYNSGNCCIKLKKNEPYMLRKGALFTVGDIPLLVTEESRSLITLRIAKGEHQGQEFCFTKNPTGPTEKTIGKVSRSDPKDVSLDNSRVSRLHAKVSYVHVNWALTDLGSGNGTWLYMTNSADRDLGIPSKPRKLRVNEVIGSQVYRFEVISI
jgi:hypothetical protein